jgi:hypothetical protein
MSSYEIMGELTRFLEDEIDKGLSDFIKKYEGKDNYFLVYPLLNLSLGVMKEPAESYDNLFNRCIIGYIYSYIIKIKKPLLLQSINQKSLESYRKKVHPELVKIFQDYRTVREIKVGNAISGAKLEKQSEDTYMLTTSFVSDKYREEDFYFYGFDDKEQLDKECTLIEEGNTKFILKYTIGGYEDFHANRMEERIDFELYDYCRSLVRKDLGKWNGNVKSAVFKNIEELCDVIGFLYYLAFIKDVRARLIGNILGFDEVLYDMLLMSYDKEWLISKISEVSSRHRNKVESIIDYLTNQGGANVLEFPLFKLGNKIVTISSLIMVNDWQFTIINGHHVKNIDIKNRDKTISSITESRIYNLLHPINNVLLAKEKYYEYIDENGEKKKSDIDYAIYDLLYNKLLIIEAKWKDNHYYDEIDKSYIKIESTFNEIFNTQITNHKNFMSKPGSLEYLFDGNKALGLIQTPPEIFYLAVDKRSQLHKNGNHMISEFMLLSFLKVSIINGVLNLGIVINGIAPLQTKVEYKQFEEKSYMEFKLGNGKKVLIEDHELYLKYKF